MLASVGGLFSRVTGRLGVVLDVELISFFYPCRKIITTQQLDVFGCRVSVDEVVGVFRHWTSQFGFCLTRGGIATILESFRGCHLFFPERVGRNIDVENDDDAFFTFQAAGNRNI